MNKVKQYIYKLNTLLMLLSDITIDIETLPKIEICNFEIKKFIYLITYDDYKFFYFKDIYNKYNLTINSDWFYFTIEQLNYINSLNKDNSLQNYNLNKNDSIDIITIYNINYHILLNIIYHMIKLIREMKQEYE